MLTTRQYQILSSCADDVELFYFPFAHLNFGGQLFADSHRASHAIQVKAEEIASDLVYLINQKLLECSIVSGERRTPITVARPEDFAMYQGYNCRTFDEHMDRFGYGPHEFVITQLGIDEINKDEQSQNDAKQKDSI